MSNNKFNALLRASLKSGVAVLPLAIAFATMPASAQTAGSAAKPPAADSAQDDDAAAIAALVSGQTGTSKSNINTKDIVVTGTNIRGVQPTGTNLQVLSREDIQRTGLSSVDQLLTQIPGIGNFNQVLNNNGAAAQGGTQINRPNLRGTPDGDNGPAGLGDPGTSTLILIDGNRQSGGGIRSVATDPDSIPPALLERVEVNTDGASAAYGSDAIGGVINFVTRRKYDGVEASGHLGYADNYWKYDGNILAGKDWGSGSFYVNGNYAGNSPLYNIDRSYSNAFRFDTGQSTSLNCPSPNISIAAQAANGTNAAIPIHYYALNADGTLVRTGTTAPLAGQGTGLPAAGTPTAGPGTPNLCNPSDFATKVNKNKRYSVNANFSQKITDSIDVLVRGNYAYNKTHGIVAPVSISLPVSANNPWRQELRSTTGADATYPTIQPGWTTPIDDVVRACTTVANCTINGVVNPIGSLVVPVAQSVLTNLGPVYGNKDNYADNWSKKFGGSAELNWHIDNNWLLKVTGVYDRTTTLVQYGLGAVGSLSPYQDGTVGGVCTAAIATYAAAGGNAGANAGNATALAARAVARQSCLDPYNPALSNATILANAHNIDNKSLAHEAIIDGKFNLDGAIFDIPGGKVKIAVGGEYEFDSFEKWQYTGQTPVPFSAARDPFTKAVSTTVPAKGFNPALSQAGDRWSYSGYGEINIPLVSRLNEMSWIKELRLRGSVRYDKYQIFGSTFNPSVGVSFKPTNWVTFSGNYNKSFRAPNILLSAGVTDAQILVDSPLSSQVPYGNSNPLINSANQVIWIFNAGGKASLKPQTGNEWSVAMEIAPFRGFRAKVTYSHIDYFNSLTSPNIFALIAGQRGSTDALASLGGLTGAGQGCTETPFAIVLDPRVPTGTCTNAVLLTPAQVTAAKAFFCAQAANCADVMADGRDVYGLYDTRYNNTGNAKIANLDYSVSYNTTTGFGSIFASVAGSIKLNYKTQTSSAVPFIDAGVFAAGTLGSKHSMTARAGFNYGALRASATLLHSDGYAVVRSATAPQDRVGDFNIVNLFATWDFKGDNVIERNLQLSLGIDNVLNTNPPVRYTNNTVTTANGSTIGRLVQIGFNKKF